MVEYVETVIVGAGQAGLATAYYLTQEGREHVILERAALPGSVWRDGRWDSFTLVTPNWMILMPGAGYDGGEPDGFMPRDEIVAYFGDYAERLKLPIRYNTEVTSVDRDGNRYLVRTANGSLAADNVVMATGVFQRDKIPAFAAGLPPSIHQVHSGGYRAPEALPSGAVLVVGSGQSGCQIAEELYQGGRKVYLCVGGAPRAPRRYRGKDLTWWLTQVGFFDRTLAQPPSPEARYFVPPHVSGKGGGHTINLHQFARDGVVLLGRMVGVQDGVAYLAPNLKETLAKVDQWEVNVLKQIDGFVLKQGLQVPEEVVPQLRDGYDAEIITELDLEAAGISSVIWANGYSLSYDLVKLPVLDAAGFPVQESGTTAYPGLYFVGLPWSPRLKTAFLFGVAETAEYVAGHIAVRH